MSKLLGDDNRFRMLLWIVVLGIYTSTLWNGKKIWWWKVYPCWVIEVEMEFLTTKRNIVLRSRDLLSVRIDRVWFERRKKISTRIFKRGKLVILEIFSLNLILVGVDDSKIMAFFFETQVQFFLSDQILLWHWRTRRLSPAAAVGRQLKNSSLKRFRIRLILNQP